MENVNFKNQTPADAKTVLVAVIDEKVECQYCGWIGSKDDLIELTNEDEGDWECPKCGISDDFLDVV
jgi:Zn finger protein HypA/HybF involved in hydrogenase expression